MESNLISHHPHHHHHTHHTHSAQQQHQHQQHYCPQSTVASSHLINNVNHHQHRDLSQLSASSHKVAHSTLAQSNVVMLNNVVSNTSTQLLSTSLTPSASVMLTNGGGNHQPLNVKMIPDTINCNGFHSSTSAHAKQSHISINNNSVHQIFNQLQQQYNNFFNNTNCTNVGGHSLSHQPKWEPLNPKRLAISVHNFKKAALSKSRCSPSSSSLSKHLLEFCIGDVLVVVEQCGQWYRGYLENDCTKLGIFPASYVQMFDENLNFPLHTSYSSFFYTLLDPLFLQVVRTLREWHAILVNYYRTNLNLEKFVTVKKLMNELVELCQALSKDLAPTLWRRRSSQLLKMNSSTNSKDPFAKLYLDEEINDSDAKQVVSELEPSLEELYERVLSKLNLGNQLLNMDIMPSFTHGTFSNDYCGSFSHLIKRNSQLSLHYCTEEFSTRKRNKFKPYYTRTNSKYLTFILDYYNRLNKKFNEKFKPNSNRTSLSFHSPVHTYEHRQVNSSTASQATAQKKFRRHLLLSIREANFASLFSSLSESDQYPLLQIDVYMLRCNTNVNNGDSSPYEVVSEKYCYRVSGSGQVLSAKNAGFCSVNRALFLDVLSKKASQNNVSNTSSSNSGHFHFTSQHTDSANYYLVIQVWRYGKMLINESRTKNMLSATMSTASASLSSGTSVFHTISSSSISSAAVAAASTTSLSSLTSFVSNSSLFSTDKSNTSSSTPDSASIDSSEYGSNSFKRSVGFSVVPLLELVSRDQEIKPTSDLFTNNDVISRLLLSDEQMLLSVPIKLYEGDLTMSSLETMLKYRQASAIAANSTTISSSSASSISKLSPVTSAYQLIVCAKFVSEVIQHAGQALKKPSIVNSDMSNDSNPVKSYTPSSLADYLLLSQCSNNNSTLTNPKHDLSSKNPSFVLVQKRSFGDLITAGYFRNDFYLTLESAEFEKGGKTIPKNIEVSVCLVTENGIQERAISSGANDEPVTFYRSHIQYHQNSPKWIEHVKVNVPLELFESAHLRFIFCHCSSKERERKFLGFSFLPLADNNGACLIDGEHELFIYKCDNERKLDDVSFYLNIPWGHNEKLSAANSNSTSNFSISSSNISTSTSSLATSSSLINSRSSKEIFHIRTSLVSSKLTQNSDILSLLKWSCTPLEQVYESLQRIGRVSGEEMVKFLEDILDALFALFTTSSGAIESSPQMTVIFRVLIDFFKTINDPKFASYQIALETYIENQFSAPLVYSDLMACVKKYIELVIISFQTETISLSGVTKRELEFILRCLSVFDWVLKIIVQSRILYTRATESGASSTLLFDGSDKSFEIQTDEQFRSEMLSLFSSINRLLSVEYKSSDDYLIIAIQESVLNTLPNAFGFLSQIFNPLEMAKVVKSIVQANSKISNDWSPASNASATPTNSIQSSSSSKRTIVNAKLSLLQETIRCQFVWQNEEARLELLDTFIRLMNVYIAESNYTLAILHDIVVYLIENSNTTCSVQRRPNKHLCEREIEMLSFGTIDAIVEHIIELTGAVTTSFDLLPISSSFKLTRSNSEGSQNEDEDYLGTLIVCFMVLLDFMTLKHYEKLFETRSSRQCKELIINIFVVFLNALYYFNDNWFEIKMSVNRIILHSLTKLRVIMSQEFLGDDKFDLIIWRTYFKLAIAFLTQPRLQLDSQQHWKKSFILETFGGDMRILMGFEIVSCWDLIGPYKISFIPSLVSSFVDVTLVPELELRKATIPIFFDMLSVDYCANANFKQVESALIDKLDVVAHKSECDYHFKQLFAQILTEKIEKEKPVWHSEGIHLVQAISRLLSLLIDYRNELKLKNANLKSVNEIDDRLVICTYALLRFFRDEVDSNNVIYKSIMLRYVEKLSNLHILLGNFTEAAFTLKLHADQLSWSSGECQKKELLCETMLNYFERGQCWEEGIKVCKDLQTIYESSYKYSKLSSTLKRYGDFLDKILTEHRQDSEYFRVSFFGLDFPFFLQNTTFVFRGLEFEKISSFTHRIQQEFPNAQLLTKTVPTDENITESNCQYIQIFAVKPVAEPPVTPDQSLMFGSPDNVLSYYNTNFVQKFIQDRPIQRAPFDPNNEFKSLWIERTIYSTEKPLPGVLRMFQVTSTEVTYLSPIENACETIENMNNELTKLISTYSNDATRPESISPLSMRLQGILDAAVNGGIAKYIDAFLGSEFLNANPDQISQVTRLKDRISLQIKIVESGLSLHGRLAPTPVRPLHTRLLERFSTMRNTVNQANIETSQAILWTPNSSSNQLSHRPSILSQPLPPIPNFQRQDTLSDPDTSSLSSSSSNTQNNICIMSQDKLSRVVTSTPPLSQPPPPPSFLAQSPGGKSLKNKPLPPLPKNEYLLNTVIPASTQATSAVSSDKTSTSFSTVYRSHSCVDQIQTAKLVPITDDSIYSVPQLPDVNTDNENLLENESSVDDSLDYCDLSHDQISGDNYVEYGTNSRSLHRSRSIPRSTVSMYNGSNHFEGSMAKLQRVQSNYNLQELDEIDSSPPPLPPRSSNLDRSNSLNSNIRPNSIQPPMIPPALPQRPVRKSSSTCATNVQSNVLQFTPVKSEQVADPSSYLTNLDGIEFENLVISSPTPRSDASHQSCRPAPIIGIEIENNEEMVNTTPLITDSISFVDAMGGTTPNTTSQKIQEHRSKSSSLPRMQQFALNLESYSNATATSTTSTTFIQHSTFIHTESSLHTTRIKSLEQCTSETNSSLLD